ncbi:MAG: hypothetical protein IJP43_09705 [Oscillospiraceae bacterium]|nr:hypothetical protein [Oscillospiraceae bacterium]
MNNRKKQCEIILYIEDGFTQESIIAEIKKRSVDKYCIACHDKDTKSDGTPDKPHYHVYLHFANGASWPLDAVAKWFGCGEHLVSPINADKYGNGKKAMYNVIRYYTHCDFPNKAQYDASTFVSNFDVNKFLAENAISFSSKVVLTDKLDVILGMCANGKITKVNLYEYMTPEFFSKYKTRIDAVMGDYHNSIYFGENGYNRELTAIYAFGKPGSGKTTLSKLYCEQLEKLYYVSSPGRNYGDEYRGEPMIIMDDIRAEDIPFVELIKLVEPHTNSALKARNKNKINMSDTVFLTSIFSPKEFIKSYHLVNEDPNQFYRRLSAVWEVTREYIFIYTISDDGVLTLKETVPNPVPNYLKTLPPKEDTIATSVGVLNAVAAKYSHKEDTQ